MSETNFNRCFVNMSKQDGSFDKIQQVISNLNNDYTTAEWCASECLSTDEQQKSLIMHIEVMLRSGYHPSLLSMDEHELMKQAHGSDWKSKFGYDDRT